MHPSAIAPHELRDALGALLTATRALLTTAGIPEPELYAALDHAQRALSRYDRVMIARQRQ